MVIPEPGPRSPSVVSSPSLGLGQNLRRPSQQAALPRSPTVALKTPPQALSCSLDTPSVECQIMREPCETPLTCCDWSIQSNPWFWFVIFYRTIFLEMYTHHPANSFSSLSKVCWGDSWHEVFVVQWFVPVNRSWIQFNSFQLIECNWNWIKFKSMNSLFSIYCVPLP